MGEGLQMDFQKHFQTDLQNGLQKVFSQNRLTRGLTQGCKFSPTHRQKDAQNTYKPMFLAIHTKDLQTLYITVAIFRHDYFLYLLCNTAARIDFNTQSPEQDLLRKRRTY